MIADLKSYAEYKESGVEWLGDMPGHWGVRRLKGVVDQSRPITYGIVQCGEHIPDGIPYVRPVDMKEDGSVSIDKLKRTSRAIAASYRRSEVRGGDVVVSIGPSFGKVMIIPNGLTGANLTQGTARIAPGQATSAAFLLWLVRSQGMHHSMAAVATGSTFLALNLEPLGRIRVPLPPPDEQAAIVRFLDWANGRLERAIRAKRKVIALLNEQKQAIIHRAVTRGLDPSVPLKPSGIPWLGDIPRHWEVKPIKQVCRVFGRIGFRGYTVADLVERGRGALSLSPGELRDGHITTTNSRYISLEKYEESPEIKIFPGDILFVKTGSTTGKVARVEVLPGPATINPQLVVLKHIRANGGYLVHSLARSYVQAQVQKHMIGGSTPTITQAKIASFKILLPADAEQAQIVDHIEAACAPASAAIFRCEREIELLREYRTRLVADVVTGKLDVREAAARLPNEAPLDSVEDAADLRDETEAAREEAAV